MEASRLKLRRCGGEHGVPELAQIGLIGLAYYNFTYRVTPKRKTAN